MKSQFVHNPVTNKLDLIRPETDLDGQFVNVTGDTMTGDLRVPDGLVGIKAYDAVVDVGGDGTHTDIESAIDAGAKSIFVRDGTYTLSQAIDVDQSGIEITGETREGVIIAGNAGAYSMFIVTATNFSIRNLTINGLGEDEIAIIITSAVNVDIDSVTFNGCDTAVSVEAAANTVINNCEIDGTGVTTLGAIKIVMIGGTSAITRISGCDITTNQSSSDKAILIGSGLLQGTDSGEVFITDSLFTVITGAIAIDANVSFTPFQVTGCRFNIAGNAKGIEFSSVGRVLHCHFNQTGAAATANEAIDLLTRHSEVIGNSIAGGFFNGITNISPNCRIIGNRFEDCVNDGIQLTTADNNVIMGNVFLNNGRYGVNLDASTADGNIIIGNVFDGNTTGQINDGGTGTQIGHNVLV